MRRYATAVALVLVLAAFSSASGQRRSATDGEIVRQATLVAAGDRVEIYQHGVAVAPAFLEAAEDVARPADGARRLVFRRVGDARVQ